MVTSAVNLVDSLRATLEESGEPDPGLRVDIRTSEEPFADARVMLPTLHRSSPHALQRARDRLSERGDVAAVRRRRATLYLRLTDDHVARIGERLLSGRRCGLFTADLLSDRRFLVGFVGPNTTKALHVGHLRNISLGHGLASALAAAGAAVETLSPVSDIGRNVAEALVGLELYHPGETPEQHGVKGDRFVGQGYRDFLLHNRSDEAGDANRRDPARDARAGSDRADERLREWARGDTAVRREWATVRDWVMVGHRQTLERLGVVMQREALESNAIPHAQRLARTGLERGLLRRRADGAVVYDTNREEFPTMYLQRADGFPTQHLRLIALYDRLLQRCAPGCTYVDVCGSEWQPAFLVHLDLLRHLRPEPRRGTLTPLYHGMVTFHDRQVSSSVGSPELIDDLLDRLRDAPEVVRLVDRHGSRLDRETIVALLVKGHFLCQAQTRPVEFSRGALFDPLRSPGWTLAEAWCRASQARESIDGFEPCEPGQRLAVLRSQAYRHALEHSTHNLDLSALTGFTIAYSKHVATTGSIGATKVAGAVLGRVFAGLGLLDRR